MMEQSLLNLLGWSEQELMGQPMNRLIPPRFHRILDPLPVFDQEPQESQPKGTRVSLFARRRDGSEFPVEINRSPLGPRPDAPDMRWRSPSHWPTPRATWPCPVSSN